VGDHENGWKQKTSSGAADSFVYVPILANDHKWGTVEIRFAPIGGLGGIWGYILHPSVRLVLFVSAVCYLLFGVYLRKMLQHLDPSKVVPERVRSALDTLTEGLLVLDNQERIMLANHAFAMLIGKTPDELMGVRVRQMPWVEDEKGETEKPWTCVIDQRQPRENAMLRLRDSAGVVRSFAVNCSPVLGQDGKYRGVLASFDDVTQLESQKIELHKSKEIAEAANQAKSEFLARMSHEIRTPMNAILGFADILRRGYETNEEERREYLDTIHASGQHLLELINDILDLSKIESGRMQIEQTRFSPHQAVSDVLKVLRVKATQKGIGLDYAWAGPVPETILNDPTRLKQIVTNIVGNAIKFTEKGSVRVVMRHAEDGAASRLAIDITDTGIGIRAESLGQLFQPFTQADTSITRRFGGTGLGLAISRQLAEAMGGELMVRSEYGQGSTFSITVQTGPMQDVELIETMPVGPRVQEDAAALVRLPKLRVLSVEDGESNQKLISIVLQRAGVASIDQARNGREGLSKALSGDYDIVLMDMQMPVMDGYTAVAELRQAGSTVPVVAMTAHAMKGEEEKCLAAGCTGYVPKPIEVEVLLRKIAEAVGIEPEVPKDPPARALEPVRDEAPGVRLESSLPMDDPDFREVAVEFASRLQSKLDDLQRAWEGRELARVASVAHWIKGSGGTAGFDCFTQPARELEEMARESQLDEIERTIEELCGLASRIVVPMDSPGEMEVLSGRSE
jgi:PAS domain S-box-containing protein